MGTTAPQPAPAVSLHTIALSAIVPIDGFNQRMAFDDAELRALSASMLQRGCLVPILVQARTSPASSAAAPENAGYVNPGVYLAIAGPGREWRASVA